MAGPDEPKALGQGPGNTEGKRLISELAGVRPSITFGNFGRGDPGLVINPSISPSLIIQLERKTLGIGNISQFDSLQPVR